MEGILKQQSDKENRGHPNSSIPFVSLELSRVFFVSTVEPCVASSRFLRNGAVDEKK